MYSIHILVFAVALIYKIIVFFSFVPFMDTSAVLGKAYFLLLYIYSKSSASNLLKIFMQEGPWVFLYVHLDTAEWLYQNNIYYRAVKGKGR